MKRLLLIFFLLSVIQHSMATHIIGGEMRYEYLGPGIAPNSKQYKVSLLLLRGPTGATFIPSYVIGVFNNDDNQKVPGPAVNNNWLAVQDFSTPLSVPILMPPCILLPPNLIYTYKTYSFIIELQNNLAGYTVAFQTFSRQGSDNINPNQGANYTCVIPGTNVFPFPFTDNSPVFKLPVSVICENSNFSVDFSATDVDGDSLVYEFCNALDGGAANQADFQDPVAPPYNAVLYAFPFNGLNPLGNLVSINRFTGIISGISPPAGKYVVCVCVSSWRNGVLVAVHRKDLIVEISPCVPTAANPMPGYVTCDGYAIQFSHTSTGANSVFWDFGDPTTLADTSILDNPTYFYQDSGIYIVKFIINKGGNCTDSATRSIGVYRGFFPAFTPISPACVGQPLQFNDSTRTEYGVVSNWSWNFGDPSTLSDTSHVQNPTFIYNTPGTYTVKLIVGNSKGCIDSTTTIVTVLPSPVLSLFPSDTLYCGRDSLQLTATGSGNFSWLPNSNILGANTASPFVFPVIPTEYHVTLDLQGCKARDSITVTPVFDLVNNFIANPTTICEGDTLTLTGSSNHTNVSWQWNPTASLSSPNSQVTSAFPANNTAYTLQTKWGNNCIATTTKNIPVKPLALPNAGSDKFYCTGQPAVQLNATGGDTYQWTPVTGLNNPNIANPLANPLSTTLYTVAVGVNGCFRKRTDSLTVTVKQKPSLQMPGDTLICIIDTLKLNASGAGNFLWTPDYNIDSISVTTPLVSPDIPTWYYVRLTDTFNCFRDDSVFVDVKPDVMVNAGNDTSICKLDGYRLTTTGDAVSYTWTPSTGLNNAFIKNPFANPDTTTDYIVTANIGKCQRISKVKIKVADVPLAKAGPPQFVCIGYNSQLGATGGSIYEWSPATFLSDPFIANPLVLQPTQGLWYKVSVSDTLGCTRITKDSLYLQIVPKLNINAGPSDTSIVDGEPLRLFATGGISYLWTPDKWLSNPNIATPVATPPEDVTFHVTGVDASGCVGTDTIRVNLFNLEPDLYVPTAFTPNGDTHNDFFKPILIGMRSLTYFRVYNRFGQMVYSTNEIGKGWDGKYGGKPQDMATFVWMAEGITYKGHKKTQKGYVVLIR